MTSWQQILSSVHSPDIRCCNATAYVNDSVAYVVCHETLSNSTLIATNIFILEDNLWKLIHHQAGPTPGLLDEDSDRKPTLNWKNRERTCNLSFPCNLVMKMSKKLFIKTFGCQMNEYDSDKMRDVLNVSAWHGRDEQAGRGPT